MSKQLQLTFMNNFYENDDKIVILLTNYAITDRHYHHLNHV